MDDVRLRVEAAERLGISVKRFGGWEPRTVTKVKRDKRGRVKSWTTRTEPEWDEQERAWMLALALWRATRCQGCSGPLHETTDPDNEDSYVPLPPVRCWRCTGLARAATPYGKSESPHALIHRVELRRRG